MKRPVTYAGLAVVAILLLTAMMESSPGAMQAAPQRALAVQAATTPSTLRGPSHTPRTALLFNDPVREPHAIADAITANIDATGPGEAIDVSAYLIDSPRIANALERAHRRGVAVRSSWRGARTTARPRASGSPRRSTPSPTGRT